MPEPTNLTLEKLRRSFAKCVKSSAELEIEIKKLQLRRTRSKLARERRQRQEGRTASRLTVVTK